MATSQGINLCLMIRLPIKIASQASNLMTIDMAEHFLKCKLLLVCFL